MLTKKRNQILPYLVTLFEVYTEPTIPNQRRGRTGRLKWPEYLPAGVVSIVPMNSLEGRKESSGRRQNTLRTEIHERKHAINAIIRVKKWSRYPVEKRQV